MRTLLWLIIVGPLLLLVLVAWWLVCLVVVAGLIVFGVCDAINKEHQRQLRIQNTRRLRNGD